MHHAATSIYSTAIVRFRCLWIPEYLAGKAGVNPALFDSAYGHLGETSNSSSTTRCGSHASPGIASPILQPLRCGEVKRGTKFHEPCRGLSPVKKPKPTMQPTRPVVFQRLQYDAPSQAEEHVERTNPPFSTIRESSWPNLPSPRTRLVKSSGAKLNERRANVCSCPVPTSHPSRGRSRGEHRALPDEVPSIWRAEGFQRRLVRGSGGMTSGRASETLFPTNAEGSVELTHNSAVAVQCGNRGILVIEAFLFVLMDAFRRPNFAGHAILRHTQVAEKHSR